MRRIYSTRFDLGQDPTKPPAFDDVIGETRAWVGRAEGRAEESHAPKLQHDIAGSGRSAEGDKSVETLRWGSSDKLGWALRWVQPGDEADPRIISDIVLRSSGTRLSFSLHVGYERGLPYGRNVRLKRPRLVPQLIKKYGAFDGSPISVDASILGEDSIEAFVSGVLGTNNRRLPVV